jgi:hypothetical protein
MTAARLHAGIRVAPGGLPASVVGHLAVVELAARLTWALSPVSERVYDGAPSEHLLLTLSVPPGAPTVYTVVNFPAVAARRSVSVTAAPAGTWSGLKLKVVSLAAA